MFLSSSKSEVEGEGEGEQKDFPASVLENSLSKAVHGNPSAKTSNHHPYLDVPLQSAFARSSDTLSDLSTYSADNENERCTGRLLTVSSAGRLLSSSPAPSPMTWKETFRLSWASNKGLALVMLAQLFGVMMNVTIRLLETAGTSGPGMHPFQILFARMIGTLVLSGIYQWWAKLSPFGSREVRGLLIARGVGGFFGVYGMYYSLQYLPLSDATVITFLAPIVACWACSYLLHEPFGGNEQVAGIVSFLGVVLIARPTSLLPHRSDVPPVASGAGDGLPSTNVTMPADLWGPNHVTSAQRLSAVGVALIGVLGAASAYTTIRCIGKRAHPLVSVNYFAAWSTLVSTVALLAVPGIDFQLPANLRQWIYLVFLGICGFLMQFLLTAGLQHEKGSRATNMVYTQMLFALAFDKIVFNTTPGAWGIAGSSLILGSALYVALHNNNKKNDTQVRGDVRGDEELALVGDDAIESDFNNGTGPLRGVQEVQLRTLRV
ncbi:hypothetical protein HO133_010714 [Letharia lupina]|uniref:EamA domain-containing protein n=1 Tax=Letharia lupina TaxID=560253 RepID=A0A8H6CIT0_9LECA|nr:uncharacterized protein HO133_010714 [Letharia lupina]KAF6224140.1 hypothetical protein HO133_010714 [Letharia lupina]